MKSEKKNIKMQTIILPKIDVISECEKLDTNFHAVTVSSVE